MSGLEIAVHVDRENLREEIKDSRQEVNSSEKCPKDQTDEYLAKKIERND